MNILILDGSARAEKGVTGRLVKSFVQGLLEATANVIEFSVASMNISPCNACLSCMHKTLGAASIGILVPFIKYPPSRQRYRRKVGSEYCTKSVIIP